MKNIITGLLLGAIGVWFFYQSPKGKIHRTETKTNEVTVSVTVVETQTVWEAKYQYVWKTNEVWKTNIIEKVVQVAAPVQAQPPPVAAVSAQPVKNIATPPAAQKSDALRGPRPASRVNAPGSVSGTSKHTGIKRNMDGSIKQEK